MSNIIGPINETDWLTMRLIRNTLTWMKSKDPVKYRPSIDMEQTIYNNIRDTYLRGATNDNELDAGIFRKAS